MVHNRKDGNEAAKDLARTPLSLYNKLDARFHFTVDCAADATNHLAPIWYHDFFREDIHLGKDTIAYCNCPYSRVLIKKFIKKCAEEARDHGATVVMLLPADTSTIAFRKYIMGLDIDKDGNLVPNGFGASEIIFIQPRVHFNNPDGTPMTGAPKFGSMVVVFRQEDFDGSPVIGAMGWK